MGELSLDGGLQPLKGVLPIAVQAGEAGFKGIILPVQNAQEAAIINELDVYGVSNIQEVIDFLIKTFRFLKQYLIFNRNLNTKQKTSPLILAK